ncbi:hypothetical protein Q0S62_08480, partial [Stenotrophomonas indicatrix]|uniref:hypothetical protein n=1 Tax=Stenotrophomonas indicatrix TaxID=2045451 RepID=UPI00265645FC
SNVCKMDNHPSCRRLHKIPAHTFKDLGKWPQRRSRVLRSFLRSEAAHYSRLFRFVNTLFQGRLTEVDVVADAASSLDPKAFRRCEPPIMPDFSSPSTPSFDDLVRRWWRCCSRCWLPKKSPRCSKGANSRDPAEFVNTFFSGA